MLLKLILTSQMVMELQLINPFVPNAPRFSDVFREGLEKGALGTNGLNDPLYGIRKIKEI